MKPRRSVGEGKSSQFVNIRMSCEMVAAGEAAAKAAGMTFSLWVRELIAAKTGVSAKLGRGQAGMTDKQRAARLATFKATIAARHAGGKTSS